MAIDADDYRQTNWLRVRLQAEADVCAFDEADRMPSGARDMAEHDENNSRRKGPALVHQ